MTARPAPPSAMVEAVLSAMYGHCGVASSDAVRAVIAAMFDNLDREAMAELIHGQTDLTADQSIALANRLVETARTAALGSTAEGNHE
jgi:hypothetical protein